jgi:hypothetical protein
MLINRLKLIFTFCESEFFLSCNAENSIYLRYLCIYSDKLDSSLRYKWRFIFVNFSESLIT